MVETEIKLKLDPEEWQAARSWLEKNCARGKASLQRDVYYAHPCRDFAETDEALRIRHVDGECVLTYKGPKRMVGGIKSREELKLPLGQEGCSVVEEVLSQLGFTPVAEVVKRREKYRCPGGYKVALDSVEGLGLFMEVEVEGDVGESGAGIREFLSSIGVRGEVVEETYLELIMGQGGRGARP